MERTTALWGGRDDWVIAGIVRFLQGQTSLGWALIDLRMGAGQTPESDAVLGVPLSAPREGPLRSVARRRQLLARHGRCR